MGDQWNLAALTYSLFVGDCVAIVPEAVVVRVKEIQKWWIFDSGTR
jgi:hypothetical protein